MQFFQFFPKIMQLRHKYFFINIKNKVHYFKLAVLVAYGMF